MLAGINPEPGDANTQQVVQEVSDGVPHIVLAKSQIHQTHQSTVSHLGSEAVGVTDARISCVLVCAYAKCVHFFLEISAGQLTQENSNQTSTGSP